MDFRKSRTDPRPIYINGDCMERVSVFRFLSLHLEEDLSWKANTTALVNKAQQRLHFLRILKKNNMPLSFYWSSVESVLTYCISVWLTSCAAGKRSALQRVINTAQKIVGRVLLPLEELYRSRSLRKTSGILKDTSHPAHHLFQLLPPGRRDKAIKSRTNRLRNRDYPKAITLTNEHLK